MGFGIWVQGYGFGVWGVGHEGLGFGVVVFWFWGLWWMEELLRHLGTPRFGLWAEGFEFRCFWVGAMVDACNHANSAV